MFLNVQVWQLNFSGVELKTDVGNTLLETGHAFP